MNIHIYKLKQLTKSCLLVSLTYGVSSNVFTYAENKVNTNSSSVKADFNNQFLVGSSHKMDLSQFTHGNPVLPGKYNLDIFINGEWVGKKELLFKKVKDSEQVEYCFEFDNLSSYKIDLSTLGSLQKNQCLMINKWIPQATSSVDINNLRYDISIPQANLQRQARGYVPPELWDRGVNAAFLNYNLNTFTLDNHDSTKTDTFLSLNTGINLFDWQLRHNGNVAWQEHTKTKYETLNTYAQKAFPKIKSLVTIGESFTSGDLFDSFAYTGVQFRTDDRMLPESQTGYAPIIRGVAQTNALIEIKQNNQLIYQRTVAAGKFEIDDLYPTGYGGEIEVTVKEANGQIQRFFVPYASVTQMLRAGYDRYSATLGRVRNDSLLEENNFVQTTYQRGINNHLTSYVGAILSENYKAIQLGSAFGTPIGAVSIDMTHSDTDLYDKKSEQGQSYRISYSKFVLPTNTNFTLAAYRYSTKGYYSFQDANQIQDYENRGLSTNNVDRQKSQFQISLNQGLKENWGNVYFTGSWNDYWNNSKPKTDFQIGYGNSYKAVNYNLSAQKITDAQGQKDTHYFLSLSLPLEIKNRTVSLSQSVSDTSNNTAISGSLLKSNALNYSASISNIGRHDTAGNITTQYRTGYTTLGASAGVAENYNQFGFNASGSILAHAGGVNFSPNVGDTMVLVQADNAVGATINSSSEYKVNSQGYALIPSITPYRTNEISIDPKGMVSNTELESTSAQMAPYAGAISKVTFKTKTGFPILISAKQSNGEGLPFSANVLDENGDSIGVVSQGSQVYLRTPQTNGVAHVQWGLQPDQQCKIAYQINKEQIHTNNMIMLEGQCK